MPSFSLGCVRDHRGWSGMGVAAEQRGAIRMWRCEDVPTSYSLGWPHCLLTSTCLHRSKALLPWWMHHIIDAPHHPDQHLLVQGWIDLSLQLGREVNWGCWVTLGPSCSLVSSHSRQNCPAAHSITIMVHLVCKKFTKYPLFVWCSFRDFLLKMFLQTRSLKEQVWQHPRPITPLESSQWEEYLKPTPLDKKVPAKHIPKFWQKINTGISF